jgi:exopolyphosphatase/guanosine-5'-triphosphate,3'-diphosphate pyrophosphatase
VVDLGDEVSLVFDDGELTRLGDSLASAGRLEGEPLERTVAAMARYAALARDLGADLVCFATASLRDAANRDETRRALERVTECRVHLISGDTEADLNLIGARAGMHPVPDRLVTLDVGGGSTEVAWGGASVEDGMSVPLGSRKLATVVPGFSGPGPVPLTAVEEGSARVAELLAERGIAPPHQRCPLAGIGGTITTAAAMHLRLPEYDPLRVHGSTLTTEDVAGIVARLAPLARETRARLLLEPERADLIIPGLAIVIGALRWLERDGLTVNVYGLRLGVLTREGRAALGREAQ